MSNISFISYREIIVKILHISVHLLCFQVIETMLELWRWSSICGKKPSTWCEQTIVQRSSNYSQTERLHVSMTFTSNANLYHVTKFPYTCRLPFFISTQFLIEFFELFLSAHFLFWEILNFNLTFAVYVKLKLSNNSVQAETSANIVPKC